MKAIFDVVKPENIIFQVKIEMSLKDWMELDKQLSKEWPAFELSRTIHELVRQARSVFYCKEEKGEA